VDGGSDYEYYLYLWDSKAYFTQVTASNSIPIALDSQRTSYIRRDILEIRLPLSIFPALSGPTVTLYPFSYTPLGQIADSTGTAPLTLTR
jgi:hypothetical protein